METKRLPRQAFKGIRTIPYPSKDIFQIWASKDYAGEIRLDNSDGNWKFNPPIQISQIEDFESILEEMVEEKSSSFLNEDINTTITIGGILSDTLIPKNTALEDIFRDMLTPDVEIIEYAPDISYQVGDIISYISPNPELLPEDSLFLEEYLYKCIIEAFSGETPESYPNKWERLGKKEEYTDTSIFIDDVLGLEDRLLGKVKYSDIGDNLSISPDKRVNVDISYITLSDYSPSEDVQPNLNGEILIGNTIWKLENETWDDLGDGIYYPNGDIQNKAQYGLLYSLPAIQRLLNNNPGYRLPTEQDMLNLFSYLDIPLEWSWKPNPIGNAVFEYYRASKITATFAGIFGVTSPFWSNSSQLGLVPAGGYSPLFSYYNFNISGEYVYSVQSSPQLSFGGFSLLGTGAYLNDPMIEIVLNAIKSPSNTGAFSVRLVKDI